MSRTDYNNAIALIESNKELCFFAGEKDEDLIKKAEKALGLHFSPQHRDFLLKYGAGSIGAEEIYGVTSDDFETSRVPNGVWFTLVERKEINMPNHLMVLVDAGGDEFLCFDYNQLNDNNEPPIVVFIPGVSNDVQTYEIIASDFGEYLMNIIEEEIIN